MSSCYLSCVQPGSLTDTIWAIHQKNKIKIKITEAEGSIDPDEQYENNQASISSSQVKGHWSYEQGYETGGNSIIFELGTLDRLK